MTSTVRRRHICAALICGKAVLLVCVAEHEIRSSSETHSCCAGKHIASVLIEPFLADEHIDTPFCIISPCGQVSGGGLAEGQCDEQPPVLVDHDDTDTSDVHAFGDAADKR